MKNASQTVGVVFHSFAVAVSPAKKSRFELGMLGWLPPYIQVQLAIHPWRKILQEIIVEPLLSKVNDFANWFFHVVGLIVFIPHHDPDVTCMVYSCIFTYVWVIPKEHVTCK